MTYGTVSIVTAYTEMLHINGLMIMSVIVDVVRFSVRE